MSTFVTGTTGFVGAFVAARLLERTDRDIVALVRAPDAQQAQARLDGALARVLGEGGWDRRRARAVPGDITAPLPAQLADEIDAVVHSAASVSFSLPLEEAREINVMGTARVVELARRATGLERFVHVSTAYVAGTHAGLFREDDGDIGQGFRNSYERSKLEAETLVRESGLPARVVRPSIVVGEAATGWTSSFNVLYFPLQAFARGLARRVPADPAAVVDVVPVDHVADVILAALEAPGTETLHAVAGERAATAGELASLAAGHFGRPEPELVPPERFDGSGVAAEHLEVYFPYFTVQARFDDARARALGLQAPPLAEYFERLMSFAHAARWGKRSPLRLPTAA